MRGGEGEGGTNEFERKITKFLSDKDCDSPKKTRSIQLFTIYIDQ